MLHTAFAAANTAALINIGGSPLIGLLVTLIVVGLCVFVALWIWDKFIAAYVAEPFGSGARFLIIAIGVIIVVDKILQVVFGINLFGGMA